MKARDNLLDRLGVKAQVRESEVVLKMARTLENRRRARRLLYSAQGAPQGMDTLARAIAGELSTSEASQAINDDPVQAQALINLAESQLGDTTIGDVAGRDIIKQVIIVIQGGRDVHS